MDVYLPGCPPSADLIHFVLTELVAGRIARPQRTASSSARRNRSWASASSSTRSPASRATRRSPSTWTTQGEVDRRALPRHRVPRLREVLRGPPLPRDARHHRAHLRHLPGEPPAGLGQGRRRAARGRDPGDRRAAAAAAEPRPDHPVARARPSSTCPRPTSCSATTRTPRSATSSASSRRTPRSRARGIRLRQFGQEMIETLGGQDASTRPGSCRAASTSRSPPTGATGSWRGCPRRLETIAQDARPASSARWTATRTRRASSATSPRSSWAWSTPDGGLEHYDGKLRFVDADGHDRRRPARPARRTTTTSARRSSPGPTSSSPTTSRSATRAGCTAWGRSRGSTWPRTAARRSPTASSPSSASSAAARCSSSFHYHYARLIEILYCVERIEELLDAPRPARRRRCWPSRAATATRASACCEAPRGTLFHHYKVKQGGLISWVNLIIATGQNNLAMNQTVLQIARHFVKGKQADGRAC